MIRRTPIKRSPLPARKAPVNARRPEKRRVAALRNGDYIQWLHAKACLVCIAERRAAFDNNRLPKPLPCFSHAHHTQVNGTGSKGPDSSCVPLCFGHHAEVHITGTPDFEAKYHLHLKAEAARLFTLFQEETAS